MRLNYITKTVGLGALGVVLAANLAAAQCPAADTLEPNDDCLTAVPVTSGTYNLLTVEGSGGTVNEDFYSISVPVGEILTADILFSNAGGDVDLYLYDPATSPNCGGEVLGDYLIRGFTASDNETVSWANPNPVATTYIIRVELFSAVACNDYSLVVSTAPDPCVLAIDDAMEENDTCGAAVALASGAHAGLFTSVSDEDYYLVTVPAGEILTVDTTYSGLTDIDLELFDDLACTNQVDFSFSFGGTGQVEWGNASAAPATVVLRAAPDAVTGTCNNYDLNVATAPDPCLDPLSDDSFEDNDDCATAVPMNDGLYPGLFVSKADEDFYEVTVADLDTLTVNLFFSTATADIDVYLYDDLVGCGDLTSYLVRGFTGSDDETITWTNSTGGTQTYYVQVVVWASSAGECNNYDMEIIGSGGSFATPMCFGDGSGVACPCANESALGAGEGCNSSLGYGGILTASGSASVANDDIAFTITQGRPSQPSMLVQGASLIGTAFKDGVLCTGTPTERVEVVFLDANGEGTTVSSIVTNGNVSPGDTRYYQQWFRDPGGVSPCGNGSNFSNGLMVVYN